MKREPQLRKCPRPLLACGTFSCLMGEGPPHVGHYHLWASVLGVIRKQAEPAMRSKAVDRSLPKLLLVVVFCHSKCRMT